MTDLPSLQFGTLTRSLLAIDLDQLARDLELLALNLELLTLHLERLALEVGQVSVKFKTAEKTGPVGEGRSAEAQALVTICRQP